MGQDGMGDMAEMAMQIPPNSVPMVGSPGPHGYITMGGMYTNMKVREDLGDLRPEEGKDFAYGGWYQNPPGTQAMLPRRMSCNAISTRYPTSNPRASRCTTWDTGKGNERSCKKLAILGNGCVECSLKSAVSCANSGRQKEHQGSADQHEKMGAGGDFQMRAAVTRTFIRTANQLLTELKKHARIG